MDNNKGSGNFSRGVENTFKPDKPEIGPSKGTGAAANVADSRGAAQSAAADGLGAIENAAASQDLARPEDVREGEMNPDGPGGMEGSEGEGFSYTGSGKPEKGKRRIDIKNAFKRGGPVAVLTLLFGLIGGFMIGGQSVLPFSLIAQVQDSFDSIDKSNTLRTRTFWQKQLSGEEMRDEIYKKYLKAVDNGSGFWTVNDKQRERLKKRGIYVVDNIDGTGKIGMLFADSGKLKVILPDGASGVDLSRIDLSGIDADADLSRVEIDTSEVRTFEAAFKNDVNFRNNYISGSTNWRGSVGAWYDKTTMRFLGANDLLRNRFNDFREKVNSESDGDTKAAAKKVVGELLDADANASLRNRGYDVFGSDDDEDGGGGAQRGARDSSSQSIAPKSSAAEVSTKIRGIASSITGKSSSVSSMVVNSVCAVFDVVGAINLLVMAQETQQVLQIASGYFEAFDKVKAGDGTDSPIHVMAEGLTVPKASTHVVDAEGTEEVIPGKENTSAMQSEGIKAFYTGGAVDVTDESVKNFTIGPERFSAILGNATSALGAAAQSFAECTMARMVASGIGIIEDLLDASPLSLLLFILRTGISAAFTAAVSMAVEAILPFAIEVFTRDLVSDLGGENLGNAITSGINAYMGGNHQNGGGSLTSNEKYAEFAMERQSVIAEQAQYERETLSPFDVSSQYTFAGSLLKQLATLSTVKSPLTDGVATLGAMVSNSVVSMLPSASAYDVVETLPSPEEYEQNCPYLAGIGAVGDAFCNPYMITDVKTISEDPVAVIDQVKAYGGFDEKNDWNIKDGSNLSHYIKYCSQRGSAFGVADQTIADDFRAFSTNTGNSAVDSAIDGALGAVPIIGDLMDINDNENMRENLGWITGESCVAKDEPIGKGGGASWDENMVYQRFVEDQRYLESIDPDYTSPVTAYLDEYYNDILEDDSYESMLAYKSGLSKDTVVALLYMMDTWTEIANYDPAERYNFVEPEVEVEAPLDFEKPNQFNNQSVNMVASVLGPVIYADLRTRNFAV